MQRVLCASMRVPEIIAEGSTRALAMRGVHRGEVTDHIIIVMNRQRRRHARPRSLSHSSDKIRKPANQVKPHLAAEWRRRPSLIYPL